MQAVRFAAPHQIERVDVNEPGRPGPGEALLRVHQVGICGTDYSGYMGKMPFFSYPRIWGHELGVEVLECGDGVTGLKLGDRCSVEPYMNNPDSFASRRGRSNCCNDLQVIGVHRDGGLCERLILPARKLHVGNDLQFDQLALVETLAIGFHAVQRGNPQAGETVVIVGAGPIGLAVWEFVRLAGCRCIMLDVRQDRLDFCQQVLGVPETILVQPDGAHVEVLAQATEGNLAEVVIDATGNHQSMGQALELVAFTGRLVYVGITSQIISFPHPLLHRREITLLASRNAMPADFQAIIRWISAGEINTTPWITHRSSLATIVDDFPRFLRPEEQVLKAMVAVG
ncbi:MAG: zinc-binding alcohol dehydrogenase family protein [Planctomycetaceae bacterium]|nr:zinc-binding alcohol dehydrogenase family protein [Planctomycetaceae bacterium]